MPREEWALQRTGEENELAVADADRAEHREVVFGQTCPIETAWTGLLTDQGIRQWPHLAVTNGNRCIVPTAQIEWSKLITSYGSANPRVISWQGCSGRSALVPDDDLEQSVCRGDRCVSFIG